MILIDKEIKSRHDEIFIENYNEKMVQSISYDLTINQIITSNGQAEEYKLKPYEFVQIKCLEKVHIPDDLIGRVVDKNSRIRQGITITSPVYQPGHKTYIYIRIQNISMNVIDIKKGDQIAQIMFEQLIGIPETTYPNKIGASFNDEDIYRGLGKYQSEYEKSTEKYIKVKEDLDKKESAIYANILTMMGIFVSIFSMITINFSAINSANFNSELILTINLSLGIIITVFMGLIFIFLNKKNSKSYYWLFGIVVALLIAILVVVMYK